MNNVVRVLFSAEPEWRTQVGQSFLEAARMAGVTHLDLSGTGLSDTAPLATLAKLQWLGLSGTGVTDLRPLAALANLRVLTLDGTGVSDVRPLTALANLRLLTSAALRYPRTESPACGSPCQTAP
jgi:Leucine-rich repeat (LRR) protein